MGSSSSLLCHGRDGALDDMAVKPITQFPVHLDENPEDRYSNHKCVRTVAVKKGAHGLGVMIIEGKHAEAGRGIFISDIQEGSPAEQAGLSVGDMLLSVNKCDMSDADYDTAAQMLKQAEGVLNLIVSSPGKADKSDGQEGDKRKVEKEVVHAVDPKIAPIIPGQEVTIEITKEKMGLGLSIVGGSDTPLGTVIIHEVYPDGAAAMDARLKPGDQILEVNGENLREAPHESAITALRQTPSAVKMVVYREEGQNHEEDLYDMLEVTLYKKPGRGLGLSIVGRKNGPGVYISEVVKGGVAEADGSLMQGDQILQVNEHDLKTATQEYAAAILKTTQGRIAMKIGRLKAGSRRSTASPKTNDADT